MKRTLLSIAIMVIALTSCKKEMSPAECQKKYAEFEAIYQRNEQELLDSYARGAITLDQFQRRLAQAKLEANNRAATLEDCCCYTAKI